MGKESCSAIILRKTNYSDTSLIVKALTKEFGLKSFLFPGAKRKNKNGHILQPLAQINLEFYQRSDSDLPKISEVSPSNVYKNIPFDPYKSSIVFFIDEVIQKTIHENESDEALFEFLENILLVLDESQHIANFPIKFLLNYPQFLGFSLNPTKNANYFDYQEAAFVVNQPNHPYYLNTQKTTLLLQMWEMDFDGVNDPKMELAIRRELVNDLLKVYHVFFDHFKDLRSLPVLEACLH